MYPQLSIFDQQQYRAEVTQTISTAESPGRYGAFYDNPNCTKNNTSPWEHFSQTYN